MRFSLMLLAIPPYFNLFLARNTGKCMFLYVKCFYLNNNFI